MFVRFMRDYKTIGKNKIVSCGALKAKSLIKKGIAEKVDKAFEIEDLYVAKLIGVKKTFLGEIIDGVDLGYRVFNRYYNSFFNDSEKIIYTHALTGNEFYPENCEDQILNVKAGKIIVYSKSVKPFSEFFMDDLALSGLTVSDYVSDKDLRRVEIYLNPVRKKKDKENVK